MISEHTQANLSKARLELEKARKILINLDTLPDSSVKVYIEDLLSAMNLIGQIILEYQRGSRAGAPVTFEDLNREVLKKMALEEKLYDLYFYLKNMTYKSLSRSPEGVTVSSWKSSKTISKDKLKSFYMKVEALINSVSRALMNSG